MREFVDPETGVVVDVDELPWPRFRRFDDGGVCVLLVEDALMIKRLARHVGGVCEACGCHLRKGDREMLVDVACYPKVGLHYFCTRHFPYSFRSKMKRTFEPVQGENRYRAASAKHDPKP